MIVEFSSDFKICVKHQSRNVRNIAALRFYIKAYSYFFTSLFINGISLSGISFLII